MSKRRKSNQSATINRLSQDLVKLVEIFKTGGPANNFNWWNSQSTQSIFTTYEPYKEGLEIFHEVTQSILRLNPDMLSEKEVEQNLAYGFLGKKAVSQEHLGQEELEENARKYLRELLEPRYQDIDIPIANLQLDGPPFKLGHVTLTSITDQYRQWEKSIFVSDIVSRNIHMFARVHAPGVRQKAYSYALSQARLVMDVLRAFCFPLNPEEADSWQVGIVGDTVFAGSIPMLINKKRQVALQGPSHIINLELRTRLLSKLESRQWEEISHLLQKSERSRRPMENKLLNGVRWLAEATMPDNYQTRFSKIAFALETLVGGEPQKAEVLKARGIADMLAERAAFIAGKDLNDRLTIASNIHKYYGMRSDIVHGGRKGISADDIDGFGTLVRRLAVALLARLNELGNELNTVDSLASWIKTQRYTLPEQD